MEAKRKYFEDSLANLSALVAGQNYEEGLKYAYNIATFAWRHFTGYYSSWYLENELLKIAKQIPAAELSERPTNNKVLHIVSTMYYSGGHTKLLTEWIKNDKSKEHSILSIGHKKSDLLNLLRFYNLEIENFTLERHPTYLGKAAQLKNIASNYEHIVLHTHPNEILTVVAFGDEQFKTPILLNNHADHTFWVGNSIIDDVIQIRDSIIEIDKERRQITEFSFLPIIVKSLDSQNVFHHSEENIKLLSTGAEYKYEPFEDHHFFKACYEIATSRKNVIINIAGVPPDCNYAKEFNHPNIKLLGTIPFEELSAYEDECDIYLEGFPITSGTALLQPALKKKFIQLMFAPYDAFIIFPENIPGLEYPKNFTEWKKNLLEIIDDSSRRKESHNQQYEYISKTYSRDNWHFQLEKIYKKSLSLNHKISGNKQDRHYETSSEKLISQSLEKRFDHFVNLGTLNLKNKLIWMSKYPFNNKIFKFNFNSFIKFIVGIDQ